MKVLNKIHSVINRPHVQTAIMAIASTAIFVTSPMDVNAILSYAVSLCGLTNVWFYDIIKPSQDRFGESRGHLKEAHYNFYDDDLVETLPTNNTEKLIKDERIRKSRNVQKSLINGMQYFQTV